MIWRKENGGTKATIADLELDSIAGYFRLRLYANGATILEESYQLYKYVHCKVDMGLFSGVCY